MQLIVLLDCCAEPANPLLDKYQELLKAVTEKSDDFPTWTTLISTAERLVRCCSSVTHISIDVQLNELQGRAAGAADTAAVTFQQARSCLSCGCGGQQLSEAPPGTHHLLPVTLLLQLLTDIHGNQSSNAPAPVLQAARCCIQHYSH
jgi:hypothetical protein